jgi:uncharacterized protein YndB with AHSA1/START domain
MTSTIVRRHLAAPRERVYQALVSPGSVARWRVPAGMHCEVHEFDAREGGRLRVSLTYDDADRAGKSTGRTDTYTGRFARLVPGELVVEVDEFETADPGLRGEMTMTITLTAAGDGTDLVAVHDGLPEALAPADNERGWQEALDRLARLVEAPPDSS